MAAPSFFISYSTEDRQLAKRLHDDLRARGTHVYQFEESAKPGTDAWDQVLTAIDNSDWFIVLVTASAIESKPVLAEISHAYHRWINENRPVLIPGIVEPVRKPRKLATFTDLPFDDYPRALDRVLELCFADDAKIEPSTGQYTVQIAGIEFCTVSAGGFLMGEGDELHRVVLPEFRVSRHPVTNTQFGEFVADDGYKRADYWREAEAAELWEDGYFIDQRIVTGRDKYEREVGPIEGPIADYLIPEPRRGPRGYPSPGGPPEYPVVGVAWYEALAFTRWLTDQAADDLAHSETLVLPSEAEWEKAARGEDGRVYPWGNEFDSIRCNVKPGSAVGSRPMGVSPYGVEEMAGSVREWTRSVEAPYPYDDGRENLSEPSSKPRVIRGGYHCLSNPLRRPEDVDAQDLRCALRTSRRPREPAPDLGFRVAGSDR